MPPYNDVFAAAPAPSVAESTPFDGILEKCQDLIVSRLDDAISDMLDSADDVLSALLKDTKNRDDIRLLEEARMLATAQRDVIEKHFHASYVGDFQRRCDRARKIGRPFQGEYTLDDLELVDEDDLDETLKFNEMANRLRAYCEEELGALDQRVGVLLGDANLETKDNPFSPQVICDAFKHACRELDADVKVRRVLLKLFDDHVLDDIRALYKAVNALLVRNAILPQIRYSVARRPDGEAASTSATAVPPAPAASPGATARTAPTSVGTAPALPAGAAHDLFAVLQSLLTSNVVPIAGTGGSSTGAVDGAHVLPPGGVVVMQGAELLGALTRIQQGDFAALSGASPPSPAGTVSVVNVLHELKASSVASGMGQLDRMTLDIIAMLFDELFDDPKVPNGVKGLIGRLQIPVLKVAIADKSFFSTKAHPARRLLDAVGEMALRLPADFGDTHPLFAPIEQSLQSLVETFQEDTGIFTMVRERLRELIAAEDLRIEEERKSALKRAEELENLALARSVAEAELQTRFHSHALPQAVVEFLAQQWVKLMLLVYVREGAESAAWKDALDVVDQLIWSVEPKGSPEERRKLIGLVPNLLKRITAGIKAAGIEDAVREHFFAELMKSHTQVLGLAQPVASAAPAQASSPPQTARGASAAGKSASQASAGVNFKAPITVQNPFGEGEVKVESLDLDFTSEAAAGARAKREASIRRALDNLQVGCWFEFRDSENGSARRPAKLVFISPRKSRFVFAVDRAGKEVIQCTRAEISQRLRLGDAVKLDDAPEESLFDRIMHTLLSKLRMPRAAMAGH